DADGVCSTAILIESLRELGAHCDYYIPNRFTEGYGPNEQAFKNAAKSGFSVIITDRKSTRLNSSHVSISYAVFCLKKKKHNIQVGKEPERTEKTGSEGNIAG